MGAAKNTDYIKKFFKQKLLKIKFPTKLLNRCTSLSLPQVCLGSSKYLLLNLIEFSWKFY